ncbi:MAG: pyridoxal-dependent decarboxylase [Clostridium cochlearium]|uniref:pyridoxal phosphate-dependent decarboxylase family protein n=1 Tax=Clostridium cochlearium TaxID=1494 RepID=UPI00280C3734|nr:pyridoxal-dependent decarboxylase [Clostridium cochlearium]MDU1443376.1 pyridoxal-dependent decarboxylase [Clostridium cochlearium]
MEKDKMLKWEEVIKNKVKPVFMTPWQDNDREEEFKDIVTETLHNINLLKGSKEDKKCFLGKSTCCIGNENDINKVKNAVEVPENTTSINQVMKEVIPYFNGMFNLAHPKAMFNVVPPAAIPSIMGNLLGAMFNPNLVEQEYSGNIAALEIEVTSMISKLIGYDPINATGHFTFGGTGAYLFATKLALTKCLGKESRFQGIRKDAQILVSKVGHYAAKNCTDWTGIGMNNIKTINLNDDNSMDLKHLEQVMEECHKEGKPIAMIVATAGTTDAFGVDNIKGIIDVCDKFVKKHKLDRRPFIYADAVIGWAWSVFNSYDFINNPMEFSDEALKAIEECKEKIKYLHLADAVGIDFHKTGFTSYNCSMICIKDKENLKLLTRDKDEMAYLYQFSAYTPGEYTLECSRGGNYALAAWCNLKYFGLEGYRAILGNLIESEKSLRNVIKKEPSVVCVNPKDHGFVTLFRVYPKNLEKRFDIKNFAKDQYKREFEDVEYKDDLKKYNDYQFKVSEELQRMMFQENGPALSFTSEFRLSSYGEPIAAIKAYPMSPYMACCKDELKQDIINYVLRAAKNVDNQ